MMAGSALAEDPENNLGSWVNANSTVRFSDQWSFFAQAEVRHWEFASNRSEILLRGAGHYDFSPKAMGGLGYVRVDFRPFEDRDNGNRDIIENRLYQQFAIKQTWARATFEHRFRLEQRWFDKAGEDDYYNPGENDYSNRGRYRLQVIMPLNHESIQPGTYFINVNNETFLNLGDDEKVFDQNRLAFAGGYQFTPNANLQLGLLWQARRSDNFSRLQLYYTHNFDLRKC
jgi:hypothetical protein